MLRHAVVERVAGDRLSGFYRRSFATPDGPDRRDEALEAYSWSGLTSGGVTRVFWLLLTPFALVNTAVWARPPGAEAGWGRVLRGTLGAALRLLALTLTGSVVLAAASVGLDLIAWQCGTSPACLDGLPGASALEALDTPGRLLAGGAVVPALLLVLLWVLGRQTWRRYERVAPAAPAPATPAGDGADAAHPGGIGEESLAQPDFWAGDTTVRRLRTCHVASAWALVAGLVAYPLSMDSDLAGANGPMVHTVPTTYFAALVIAAAAVYLLCAVLVVLPPVAARTATPQVERPLARVLQSALLFGSVGLVALAVGGATRPRRVTGEGAGGIFGDTVVVWGTQGRLPGINELVEAGFAVQLVLVLLLFVLTALLRARGPRALRRRPGVPWANGYAGPVVAALGWLIAGGLSAGASVRVGVWLGRGPIVLPPFYSWVGAVTVLLLAVVVVVVVGMAGRVLVVQRRERAQVLVEHPGDPADADYVARTRTVARARALAGLTDSAGTVLLLLVGTGVLLVTTAALWYALTPSRVRSRGLSTGWLAEVAGLGAWLMGASALGFVLLGLAAYRTPALRRTVGVVWDITSFWPRAAHPLAPPCYSERIIPDLTRRIRHLARRGAVIVSAHSQGTVIALATILQLGIPDDPEQDDGDPPGRRLGLLTYGSPLTRLYAAFFPAFFGRSTYDAAMARLGYGADPGTWPWRNLYRSTDPIGGWVIAPAPLVSSPEALQDLQQVDVHLVDPAFARVDGDPAWPPTYGHGDYWADPAFEAARRKVLRLRAAGARAGARAGEATAVP